MAKRLPYFIVAAISLVIAVGLWVVRIQAAVADQRVQEALGSGSVTGNDLRIQGRPVSIDVIGVHAHIQANDTINVIMRVNPIPDSPVIGDLNDGTLTPTLIATGCSVAPDKSDELPTAYDLASIYWSWEVRCATPGAASISIGLRFHPNPGSTTSESDSRPYYATPLVSVTGRWGSDDLKAIAAAFVSLITGLATLRGIFKSQNSNQRSSVQPSAQATPAKEPT